MEIVKNVEANKVVFAVQGNLDTVTSPDLQNELNALDASINDITFDFSKLDYISSAGLRVMLTANKKMVAIGGKMVIANSNPSVKEVFDMTGFSDIFTMV